MGEEEDTYFFKGVGFCGLDWGFGGLGLRWGLSVGVPSLGRVRICRMGFVVGGSRK